MPIYAFKCPKCNARKDEILSVANRHSPVPCDECQTVMEKQFIPINFKISNRPFDFGKTMDPEKEQQQILERTGGWKG